MDFQYGWPYAAKAAIQHESIPPIVFVWITFRFAMNTDNKPANNKWLFEADNVPFDVTDSEWVDPWTMKLTIWAVGAAPDRITVEYDGPDPNLTISWNKQWEPWGPILSMDITT